MLRRLGDVTLAVEDKTGSWQVLWVHGECPFLPMVTLVIRKEGRESSNHFSSNPKRQHFTFT